MPFKCPTLESIQVIKCPHPGHISQAHKGPFIFYEVGGAVGIWGDHAKKKRLKRGAIPKKKKTERRGGHAKYFSSCRVDMMFYY